MDIKEKVPSEVAAYLKKGRRRPVSVQANEDYTLTLKFDNGEKRRYNMRETNEEGGVFAKLRRLADFQRAYVNASGAVAWDIDPAVDSGAVWSNLIDLCPDSCYLYSTPLED